MVAALRREEQQNRVVAHHRRVAQRAAARQRVLHRVVALGAHNPRALARLALADDSIKMIKPIAI